MRVKGQGDQGLIASEVAVIFPLLLALALFAVFAGRVSQQNSTVQSAADAAARAAAIEIDPVQAAESARVAAVANAGICDAVTVSDFSWPDVTAFTPGVVSLEVSCTVDNSSLGISVGERTVTANGVAVVEFWRPEQ